MGAHHQGRARQVGGFSPGAASAHHSLSAAIRNFRFKIKTWDNLKIRDTEYLRADTDPGFGPRVFILPPFF